MWHPTHHPRNKTKIFVVESEILIKYKRFKRTPNRKASLLLPGGKSNFYSVDVRVKKLGKRTLLTKFWLNKILLST